MGDQLTRLLSIRETCDRLGISRTTLWKLISERRIAKTQIGGAVRISEAAIADFIQRSTAPVKAA